MAGNMVKDMTTNFWKLDKFEGHDFRRWQKKMHFLLTTLKVVYVLTTLMPELLEDAKVEAIRIRANWENDDYICMGHLLNGMSNSLFDVYTNVESAKELWDSLESNYMAEDSLSKDDFSLVQLGSHLRIEESLRAQDSNKGKGKEVGGPSVNMTEEGDFGATTHVCKDRCWFKTFEPVEDGSVLYIGDDHFSPVYGKGSVALEFSYGKTITLFNVLYVPKLRKNLVSGPMLNKYRYKQVYEFDKYILSKSGVFVGFGYYNNGHVNYERMLEMSKDDLIPAIDENPEKYTTFACITTIRLLLALAAIHNLVIHRMDVKTSFLNGDLDEEVSMKQPEGFVMPGNEHKVCKLVNLLYGLKQAPKWWHKKFDEVVLSISFHLNQFEKCVYSKFDDSGKGVIICLYVDDMLIFGIDQNQVDKTKKFLSSRFSMKDMGEANVILGIKIKRENKGIVITQSHYIEKILKKFNREDCSPVRTPMDPIEKLMLNTGKPIDQLKYSRAIGFLMYAMTSTRSDIAYDVGRLSRFTSYSDASWINHVEDSSSTSGWVFLIGGGVILWASKKQTCITGSTMESEFIALAAAGKEAEWLRNLIHEIPIWPKPIAPISI
nr:zinc finger, CCHC-type [Tanacetum cinerariifolium]